AREVDARAADRACVPRGWPLGHDCRFALVVPKGLRILTGPSTEELMVEDDAEFVVLEVRRRAIRTLFQNDHAEAGGGEFLAEDAARGTRTDDHKVDFLARGEPRRGVSHGWRHLPPSSPRHRSSRRAAPKRTGDRSRSASSRRRPGSHRTTAG